MDLTLDQAKVHYLDSAATVYPKPKQVLERMVELYLRFGVNPGRSGYDLCLVGGNIVDATRKKLTEFFGGTDPNRLCFTSNASDALNILIQGLVGPGDHVISTVLEHNSVIRPLNHLREKGMIEVDYVPCGEDCVLDPGEFNRYLKPDTVAVIANHSSNVVGTVQPITEIGRFCRDNGLLFVIDVAQTAGLIPIDLQTMHVDALAFTGHKSLLAPTGIGGLYVQEGVSVEPTRYGGTGVRSAHPFHLDEYPYRLEVGTLNVLGISALYLAQEYLAEEGIENIYRQEMALFTKLQHGLQAIPGVCLHGTHSLEDRLPVLSFTIDGWDPSDIGTFLDVDYCVACRTGLQCAPLIHEHMGTAPRGTVRFSVGPSNTVEDIDVALAAVREIAQSRP
jgi:cysteine desulfurase family protein